jgi:hypothetical protein
MDTVYVVLPNPHNVTNNKPDCRVFANRQEAENLADAIGGRVVDRVVEGTSPRVNHADRQPYWY